MENLLGTFDYILLPIYLGIFTYIIVSIKKKYYAGSPLGKYLLFGFFAKMAGSLMFVLLFTYYFQNGGDSYIYYSGGLDFKETIIKDFPSNVHFLFSPASEFGEYYMQNFNETFNYGYLSAPSNLMAAKFVAFFGIFSFDKYLIISLFFGVVSFSGMWMTFKIFCDNFPALKKHFAVAFFFLPTLLFWGSGIAKDPLCIGFLGWLFYSGYMIFIRKKIKISTLIIFILSTYMLIVLKAYIFVAFIPFFTLWIYLEQIKKISSRIARKMISFGIFISIIIFLNSNIASGFIDKSFEDFADYIGDVKSMYEMITSEEGSLIKGSDITLSRQGIINYIPVGMATTLFRPFLWEAKKFITFLSALESTLILLYTIYVLVRTRIYYFFVSLFSNSMVLFVFLFSIVFAAFVGLTCFNFGTLVRYKIPCIPFYLASLMIINYLSTLRKNNLLLITETEREN